MSRLDYSIYEHFEKRLLGHILREADFSSELNTFKSLLSKTSQFCRDVLKLLKKDVKNGIDKVVNEDIKLYLDPAPWGQAFFLHGLDCAVMRLENTVLVSFEIKNQFVTHEILYRQNNLKITLLQKIYLI